METSLKLIIKQLIIIYNIDTCCSKKPNLLSDEGQRSLGHSAVLRGGAVFDWEQGLQETGPYSAKPLRRSSFAHSPLLTKQKSPQLIL